MTVLSNTGDHVEIQNICVCLSNPGRLIDSELMSGMVNSSAAVNQRWCQGHGININISSMRTPCLNQQLIHQHQLIHIYRSLLLGKYKTSGHILHYFYSSIIEFDCENCLHDFVQFSSVQSQQLKF